MPRHVPKSLPVNMGDMQTRVLLDSWSALPVEPGEALLLWPFSGAQTGKKKNSKWC